jgi:SAM-dependent methyltransferase
VPGLQPSDRALGFDPGPRQLHNGYVSVSVKPPAPDLFDRSLVRFRLARAATSAAYPDFLLLRAADELADRLSVILRDFPIAVDLGTPGPQVARVLAEQPRVGQIYQAGPIAEVLRRGPYLSLVADEEALPFAPASINLCVSILSLHHVNDLPGTLVQVRHILQPDGLFIGCLLSGRTLQELRVALAMAEAEIIGGSSPHVAPFADLRDLGSLLQRAGFALPVSDSDLVTVRYESLFGLMKDLRAMGLANAMTQRARKPLRRAVVMRAAQIYAERFGEDDGRVRATFEIAWLTGWAPHPSQQKPLSRGAARMRLADALKTPRSEQD